MSDLIDVGASVDFPQGASVRVLMGDQAVAIVHTADGLFAIEDRCSHADVALSEGEIDGCTIECWLHGSAFDLRNGAPLSLPAITPVRIYQLSLSASADSLRVLVDPTPVTHAEPVPVHLNA